MSSSPSDLAKLPKWPFLLSDAVLLAVAFRIAWHRTGSLSGVPLVSVVVCVVFAAILCVIPFLIDYASSEHEALDERQRALEALARTTGATAEQVGIAAQALSGMAEQAKSILTLTERASEELKDRVSDLQQQLADERDEESETLERELAALRASEVGRLEGASEKIHKVASELARVEASAAKHVASAHETVAKLASLGSSGAQQISQQAETSSAAVIRAIAQAQAEASAALELEHRRLAVALKTSAEKEVAVLERRIEALALVLQENVGALAQAAERVSTAVAVVESSKAEPQPETRGARRSRSSRNEGVARVEGAPVTPVAVEAPSEQLVAAQGAAQHSGPGLEAVPLAESVPQSSEHPVDNESSSEIDAARAHTAGTPSEPALQPASTQPVAVQGTDEGATPELPLGGAEGSVTEYDQTSAEASVPVMSVAADGATRLIVTAYIGIGNRLYVRGEGPGLSWERGIPLQFVSIGKWRWESADASAPVRVKLFKNDQTECGSLGEIVLQPGHQAEVSATF